MQMRYLYASDFPFQNFCKLAQHADTKKNVWEKSNDAYSLSIRARTDHDKPYFDLFFTTLVTSNKTFFFQRANWKGIARHIDASSVVWSLIDNGKLANQIARLAAIVLKMKLPAHARVVWHAYRVC